MNTSVKKPARFLSVYSKNDYCGLSFGKEHIISQKLRTCNLTSTYQSDFILYIALVLLLFQQYNRFTQQIAAQKRVIIIIVNLWFVFSFNGIFRLKEQD